MSLPLSERILLKSVCAAIAVGSALFSSIAFANDNFAGPSCTSGCGAIDYLSSEGRVVYYGEDARTYRVCAGPTWEIGITVDGQPSLKLDPSLHKERLCTDVRGKSIVVTGGSSAIAFVGPVAP